MRFEDLFDAINAVATGESIDEAAILEEATAALETESNPGAIEAFAELAHDMGYADLEERALRRILLVARDLDLLARASQSLVYLLLHDRIVEPEGPPEHLAQEVVELAGRVLEHGVVGGERFNILGARVGGLLALARGGSTDAADRAVADLTERAAWLKGGQDVPPHLQRSNILAFDAIDCAEADLLAGRLEGAADRLLEAIPAVEASGSKSETARAWAVLGRALG